MPSKSSPDSTNSEVIDPQDRGLHFGDGLFETLLKKDGQLIFWDEHYDRLCRGCLRLQLPIPEPEWLMQKLNRIGDSNLIIKIIVTRGSGGRGLALPTPDHPSVYILTYPHTTAVSEEPGLAVSLCHTRLPINTNLAGLKHLNRLDYVLAAIELETRENKEEGILCDTAGFLIEGIISNLFFFLDGCIYTPSLEFSGVEGVMRNLILKYFAAQSIKVKIGRYTPELLFQASECFLSNSIRGIRSVRSVDQHRYAPGPIARELNKVFNFTSTTPVTQSSKHVI